MVIKSKKTVNVPRYELIIAEKPSAAKKIAEALSDGKVIKNSDKGVTDYLVTHKGKDIVIVNAVGHLYGLKQSDGTKKQYPVFNIEWAPSSDINKGSAFTKKYLSRIKKLAKEANEFTIATDYDVEGEVIGLNIIRFACKQKDANRMKFSTTTKSDLVKAYENKFKSLDWGQAFAGETRHKLDWFYGINISRALTNAISEQGRFKIMSTGRVQGPLLKILVDKEKSIINFKSVPYWEISLDILKDNSIFNAMHENDKFFDKTEFEKLKAKLKDVKQAVVSNINKTEFNQAQPFPFDLTALQIEAFRCFRLSPKVTLQIAQELYSNSYISYPRTSSNQLPKEIDFKKIFSNLSHREPYTSLISSLLSSKKVLKPNNGKKTDPAHPAIYPTGEMPDGLNDDEAKLYDLIVKRFIATFSDPALRETMKIDFVVEDETFILKGTRTKEKGWHEFYAPYVKLKEEELPVFKLRELVDVDKVLDVEKETQPPKRYNEASIIKELEKRNLGTKATRASILDTLFSRGYLDGKPIKVTEVGMKTFSILETFSPDILDPELTRSFEDEMEEIRQGKKDEVTVLDEAKEIIKKTISQFDAKKGKVGAKLVEAADAQRDAESFYGKCPVCADGNLRLKRGKFGMFLGCDKYPDCKTTMALPKGGLVKYAGHQCEFCKGPIVLLITKGNKPKELCINPDCPTREEEINELKKEEGKKCPKCGEGTLVLRKSAYGNFIACDKFPKCKYIHNSNDLSN